MYSIKLQIFNAKAKVVIIYNRIIKNPDDCIPMNSDLKKREFRI